MRWCLPGYVLPLANDRSSDGRHQTLFLVLQAGGLRDSRRSDGHTGAILRPANWLSVLLCLPAVSVPASREHMKSYVSLTGDRCSLLARPCGLCYDCTCTAVMVWGVLAVAVWVKRFVGGISVKDEICSIFYFFNK